MNRRNRQGYKAQWQGLRGMTVVAVLVGLSGCASQSAWQPVVDRETDAQPEKLQRDLLDCRQLALQASGASDLTEHGKKAVVGGGVLAAGGCAVGSVFGSCGLGAATGAAVGGLAGLVFGTSEAEQRFKSAYKQCLWNRGHKVLP